MRYLTTALAAMMTIALGAAPAEAQRATISPTSASGTEAERLEFEIGGVWRYNAEIQFRVISGTATEGPDFEGDSGTLCHTGESAEETCAGGHQPTPNAALVNHWPDDEIEGDETYTVEAWVARYETGETDGNGMPVIRECPTGCGRARATGTIVDLNEPEPVTPGTVSLTTETATVTEGGAVSLTVKFTPPDGNGAHEAASVDWTTEDESAIAGRDYNRASGTVRFPACSGSCSEHTRTIRVSTIQDEAQEEDEVFLVELSNPANAELANRYNEWTLITIEDDDENRPPRVTLTRTCSELSPCGDRNRIESGGRLVLFADAVDQDGTVESYKWSGLGRFSGSGSAGKRWTAPRPHVETTYTLTVTVTDDEGATASDSLNITVEGPDPEATNAPTVTLTAESYEVDGGGRLTLTASASDTDGTIESYQWSGEGTFSGSGAEVTWRAPGPPVPTDYVLSVTVTDNDGATASDSVSIRVGANSAPTVSVTSDVYAAHPGEVVALTSTAADTDGTIESYRWSGGGTGFADVETGNTTWTAPDVTEPTSYILALTVTDDDGATASDSVSIRAAKNVAPTVSLTASDYAINVGETVTLTADAHDSDGEVESYEWKDKANAGSFSDPATGAVVEWTAPNPTNPTTYTLEVGVTDDDGGRDRDSVEVRVSRPSPSPPKLTGWVTSSRAGDGEAGTFEVSVFTKGFGTLGPESFQWSGEGTFGETTVSASGTGTVVWTPPRLENDELLRVRVTVTDSDGASASELSPEIAVKGSESPNSRPTVTVSASATEIDGGENVTLDVTATDSDGTIESYTWTGSPNTGSFGTMASDGDVTWTAPVRHERTTYSLTVAVRDNEGGITEKTTRIVVTETPNHPPVLDLLSASSATSTETGYEVGPGADVGLHTYHYENGALKPGASDPDGTVESYEWSEEQGRGSFRNTGTPGTARWIAPRPDEETEYVVTVTAIDDDRATASLSRTFTVVITEVNEPPTVTLEASTTTVAGSEVVRLTASADDSDGTIESYAWSGEGTFTARGPDGKSPRMDWTAPSADGDYDLTVTVTDDAGGTASDSVTVSVTGTDNTAPTLRLRASKTRVEAGTRISLTASADDSDGTIESYAWSEEDDAGTFTARGPMDQSARVDWTAPSPDADSEYTLSVTVTDNGAGTASDSVTVSVTKLGNEPPTVSLTAAKTKVEAGEKIRLTASATDDGTIASYEWSGKGAFNTTSTPGVVDWIAPSPPAETAYELKITVIDSGGASASATVTVTVGAAADPVPVVSLPSGASAAEGETTTIEFSVTERAPSGASIGYRIGDETELARTDGSERGVGACRDYEHKSGTLNLGGRSSATLEIRPLPDACPGEPEEFVYIEFFDPVEVQLDADTLPVSISDVHSKMGLVDSRASTDDGNLLPLSVAEGESLSVTIERDIDVPGRRVPTSVEVQLVATGGAVAGEDYEDPGPQTVSFSASQSRRTVRFRALNDDLHEQEVDEGFEIHLGNPKGGLLVSGGTPGKTRLLPVVIEDTDGPREEILVSVRALTPTVTEGETARCEVKVEEKGGRRLDTGIRVRFQATDAGIENKDVWLTFGRTAEQMRQVDVETIATQANESRAFNCRVGPADYSGSYELEITEGSAEVRIENINVENQPGDAPVWAFDQRTGERTLYFVTRLNGELPDALTGTGKDPLVVRWATSAGDDATAVASEDYTVSSGTHTFHPGASRSFGISVFRSRATAQTRTRSTST